MENNRINQQYLLAYIGLPAILFLFLFVHSALAFPILILFTYVLFISFRKTKLKYHLDSIVIASSASIIMLWIIGFPFGPFAPDWLKHWAIMDALLNHKWPVIITLNDEPNYLRFYTAAYLVPAFISKLTGIPTWFTFYAWLFMGFFLIFISTLSLPRRASLSSKLAACILLVSIAGADAIALNTIHFINNGDIVGFIGLHQEWWLNELFNKLIQYSSIITSLIWVPHQSIAIFLVTLLIISNRANNNPSAILFSFGLLSLWSPYGMIGLLPLVSYRFFLYIRNASNINVQILAAIIAGISFSLLVALYLSEGFPSNSYCLICLSSRLATDLSLNLLFLIVELGIFALILGRKLYSEPDCLISIAILFILPFTAYYGGIDFVMRVSLGPLFYLSLRSIEVITDSWRTLIPRITLALLVCVPTVISEITYHLQAGAAHKNLQQGYPLSSTGYAQFTDYESANLDAFFDAIDTNIHAQYFTKSRPYPIKSNEHRDIGAGPR